MFFFPMVIRGLRLAGIVKLKYDRKNKWIRVIKSDAIRSLPINNSDNNSSIFPQRNTTSFNQRKRKEGQDLLPSSIFHQGCIVSFFFF